MAGEADGRAAGSDGTGIVELHLEGGGAVMKLIEIANAMDKLVNPGDYGLGTEPESMARLSEPITLAQLQGDRSVEDIAPEEFFELVQAHVAFERQEKEAWELMGLLVSELYRKINHLQQETLA